MISVGLVAPGTHLVVVSAQVHHWDADRRQLADLTLVPWPSQFKSHYGRKGQEEVLEERKKNGKTKKPTQCAG